MQLYAAMHMVLLLGVSSGGGWTSSRVASLEVRAALRNLSRRVPQQPMSTPRVPDCMLVRQKKLSFFFLNALFSQDVSLRVVNQLAHQG